MAFAAKFLGQLAGDCIDWRVGHAEKGTVKPPVGCNPDNLCSLKRLKRKIPPCKMLTCHEMEQNEVGLLNGLRAEERVPKACSFRYGKMQPCWRLAWIGKHRRLLLKVLRLEFEAIRVDKHRGAWQPKTHAWLIQDCSSRLMPMLDLFLIDLLLARIRTNAMLVTPKRNPNRLR